MFPLWKKILSYFWDFKLETIQSNINGTCVVSYNKGHLKLSTSNAIYSFGDLYDSFKQAFDSISIKNYKVENCLLLGVGLGSVIQLLRQHPTLKTIDAVEIDDKIIDLCKKYLKTDYTVNYIHQDAFQFVDDCTKTYDLIAVDLFIDDQTPEKFITKTFIQHLKRIGSAQCILLFSKLDVSRENKIENQKFGKLFSEIFPNAYSITTNGNIIFVSNNQ